MSKYVGKIITNQAPAAYSVYFDGSGDNLSVADNAAFEFGSGDFTVEFWLNTTQTGYKTGVSKWQSGQFSWMIRTNDGGDGKWQFFYSTNGSGYTQIAGANIANGQWHHIAVSRSGSNIRLFTDGVLNATNTSNPTIYDGTAAVVVGSDQGTNDFLGYISNLRIVKGTALYTAAFTPPTQLLNVTNTSILTCNSPAIVDQSSNAFAITVNGNSAVSTFTPFTAYVPYNPSLGASTPGVWTLDEAMQAAATRQWNMYDPYFQNTTLLLHGNGTNGAQNNTFLDSSTNNFTITRNGNTTQGSFSPFSQSPGWWSNYFDGSGDYLTVPTNSAFVFGTGDFTVEAWTYLTAAPGATGAQVVGMHNNGVTAQWIIVCYATSTMFYTQIPGTGSVAQINVGAIPLNTWVHLAMARSGTTMKGFINGVEVGSVSNSLNLTDPSVPVSIGADNDGNACLLTGYVSNVRVVKGTALYTSSFTPSTIPLTAVANTSLLTCQSNRFVDNSTNNFAITRNGDVSVQPFSPFYPTAAYTPATIGGSGYFDGTGDYLSLAANTALNPGASTTPFSIECWLYPTSTPASDRAVYGNFKVISYPSNCDGFDLLYAPSRVVAFRWGYPTYADSGASAAMNLNTWNHVVVCRNSSGSMSCFLNGTRWFNTSSNTTITNSTASSLWVGWAGSISGTTIDPFPGYIAGFRMLKGSTAYDPTQSTLTVPTAPPTAITNTSLLLNYTNAGIVDSTAKNVLETVGNAQISTTQSKFGGSSMYFDGTGDYISGLNTATTTPLGTEDWTIEFWVYPTIVDTGFRAIYVNGYPIQIYSRSSTIETYISSSGSGPSYIVTALTGPASSITVNTWAHVAFVKSGANYRVYVNGVGGSTATSSTAIPLPSNASYAIGATFQFGSVLYEFAGYVDDFRITKGVARYTTNFTPQTSQWQDQ